MFLFLHWLRVGKVQVCYVPVKSVPVQQKGKGLQWWETRAARRPHLWTRVRTTCCITKTMGWGWRFSLEAPVLTQQLCLTALSWAVGEIHEHPCKSFHVGLFKCFFAAAVSGHPVLLLPITKTEPESLSSDETDISDAQFEGVSTAARASPGAFACEYLAWRLDCSF